MQCAVCGRTIDKNECYIQIFVGCSEYEFYDVECAVEAEAVIEFLEGTRSNRAIHPELTSLPEGAQNVE